MHMNKLSIEEKVRVVACLVEVNSLRAITRMTGTPRVNNARIDNVDCIKPT